VRTSLCADGGAAPPPLAKDPLAPSLLGAWRTPSLRDVAMTGPYMHDGVFATLADVVWHYDQGGTGGGLGEVEIAPLLLSAEDRADLVSFLQTLSGQPGPAELIAVPQPAQAPACVDGGAGVAN
jgi:cytochrome c peroxidase